MWELTICSLSLMFGLLVSVILLVAALARITVKLIQAVSETQQTALESLIKPVIDPAPILQTDVPEQTEMMSEPAWAHDWSPS